MPQAANVQTMSLNDWKDKSIQCNLLANDNLH